jgi:hypothetical protein
MRDTITAEDVQSMVSHWLGTPVNGYLGSDYGQDLKSILHSPFAAGLADEQVGKLRRDVPVLDILPRGAVNLYALPSPPDKVNIVVDVSGTLTVAPEV